MADAGRRSAQIEGPIRPQTGPTEERMGSVIKWGGAVKNAEGNIPRGSIIEIGPRSHLIRFPQGGIEVWHDKPEVLAGDGGIETWRG